MGLQLYPPYNKYLPEDPFSLQSLYFRFFGGVALPYPFPRTFNKVKENDRDFEMAPGADLRETGIKGYRQEVEFKPLRGEFNFKGMIGEYMMPTKLGLTAVRADQYQLPNEPILSLRGGKQLKSTTIRRGTGHGEVTEERALKATMIRIQGLCINEQSPDYPEDQVARIRELVETAGAKHITNYLTSLWGISKVTIHEWSIPRTSRDVFNVQPYTLEMKADYDFDDFKRIMEENATNN